MLDQIETFNGVLKADATADQGSAMNALKDAFEPQPEVNVNINLDLTPQVLEKLDEMEEPSSQQQQEVSVAEEASAAVEESVLDDSTTVAADKPLETEAESQEDSQEVSAQMDATKQSAVDVLSGITNFYKENIWATPLTIGIILGAYLMRRHYRG